MKNEAQKVNGKCGRVREDTNALGMRCSDSKPCVRIEFDSTGRLAMPKDEERGRNASSG